MAYSTEYGNSDISLEAAADLSSHQYHFVKLDTDGKIVAVAAVTDVPIGVLQNDPKLGEAGSVRIVGITKLEASRAEAVNEGLIGTDASGRADNKASTDTTHYALGQALDAAANATTSRIITAVISCAAPNRVP